MKMNRSFWIAGALSAIVAAAITLGFAGEDKPPVKMPSTIIHHVTLKWKTDVADAEKQKILDDLKAIVLDVPGAKNLWVKSVKIQPRDYSQTFVIEFENEEALQAYANHPKKKEWNDAYYKIRESSFNSVTTN
jgi:hypothetical protein